MKDWEKVTTKEKFQTPGGYVIYTTTVKTQLPEYPEYAGPGARMTNSTQRVLGNIRQETLRGLGFG
jgi:hypothetical protein